MSFYTFDGVEYPGFTTISSMLDKSAGLMPWAVRCYSQYIRDNSIFKIHKNKETGEVSKIYQITDEILTIAEKEYKTVSKTALDVGSQTHDLIKNYIRSGKDKTSIKNYSDEVQNAFLAFLEWEKKNDVTWVESEQPIVHIEICYAGTLDALAYLNGKLTVIDFKTSKKIYPEYKMQVAAYVYARNYISGETVKCVNREGEQYDIFYQGYGKIEHGGILRIDKETGIPEYKDVSKEILVQFDCFLHLLDYYYASADRRLKNNRRVSETKEYKKYLSGKIDPRN